MTRPRLLDLFSGAGGAARGYQLAGFHVTGVDNAPQPRYAGDEFHQADALSFPLEGFDAVHASPPCQAYSVATKAWNGRIRRAEHVDLVADTRDILRAAGVPYAIENVPGAPLIDAVQLCGTSFGLPLWRHRLFECSFPAMAPPCAHHLFREPQFPPTRSDRTRGATVVSVFGAGGGRAKNAALWATAMNVDWMSKHELAQAIPPCFTEHIGSYLLAAVNAELREVA